MIKKEYNKPTLKVVQLDNTDIICTSARSFSINNDEVQDYGEEEEHQGVSRDIWGSQW